MPTIIVLLSIHDYAKFSYLSPSNSDLVGGTSPILFYFPHVPISFSVMLDFWCFSIIRKYWLRHNVLFLCWSNLFSINCHTAGIPLDSFFFALKPSFGSPIFITLNCLLIMRQLLKLIIAHTDNYSHTCIHTTVMSFKNKRIILLSGQ